MFKLPIYYRVALNRLESKEFNRTEDTANVLLCGANVSTQQNVSFIGQPGNSVFGSKLVKMQPFLPERTSRGLLPNFFNALRNLSACFGWGGLHRNGDN